MKQVPHFTTQRQEASSLLAFVALALFIGAAAIWLQILQPLIGD